MARSSPIRSDGVNSFVLVHDPMSSDVDKEIRISMDADNELSGFSDEIGEVIFHLARKVALDKANPDRGYVVVSSSDVREAVSKLVNLFKQAPESREHDPLIDHLFSRLREPVGQ